LRLTMALDPRWALMRRHTMLKRRKF
jgi:hypothetical protein